MTSDRQYGREDIEFETWYSPWMKRLAASYTRSELESQLYGTARKAKNAAAAHEKVIKRTTSMQSNSSHRAHARNTVAALGDTAIALRGALEIHDLFPEKAKQSS